MPLQQLYEEFVGGFPARRFSAGLLIAFLDFLGELRVRAGEHAGLDALLARYPRQSTTAAGKRANTLIVELPDGRTLSLRPFYNAAERFFRAEQKRFDYPSCAPHATQAGGDYTPWWDALVAATPEERRALRQRVIEHVLAALPSQAFDPASVRSEPPLFTLLLDGFELTARRGEPTGAALQGVVFGFLRADNPHLQVEIDKVRTGSKRLQRVGDVDAWDGARLAVSAEVKQFVLPEESLPDLAAFAHEVGRRGALGLVFALGFTASARERLAALGLKPLDVDDMLQIVGLWDPVKQRTAVSSFVYYLRHVEKNTALAERVDAFLRDAAIVRPPTGNPTTGEPAP